MSDLTLGFVLCSSVAKPIPSTRIAVLNLFPFLQSAGFRLSVIFEPHESTETPDLNGVFERAVIQNCKVVLFQKVTGANAVELARRLSGAGIRTIFVVCDRIDLLMAEATDATIVISDFLKSLYPPELQARIHVVSDGIENPVRCKRDWGTQSAPLTAALVTSQQLDYLPGMSDVPRWLNVRVVGKYQTGFNRLREIYWKWRIMAGDDQICFLRFLLNRRITCVPWDSKGVYEELVRADIGIIPISCVPEMSNSKFPPDWMIKSENRLTLKMSIGLPVIATPIPSYESVIKHGHNGFFARTPRDWNVCLNALRDPELRREMGLAARASVKKRFSVQEQASKLINVILDLSVQ